MHAPKIALVSYQTFRYNELLQYLLEMLRGNLGLISIRNNGHNYSLDVSFPLNC